MPDLRRLRVGAVVLGAGLLGALGLLVERAMESADQERRLRHQVVAERIFDELERELSSIIAVEESRPFLHWRYAYVPEVATEYNTYEMNPTLSRSPLAEPPTEPHIIGYFQLNPDGRLVTPMSPHDTETGTDQEVPAEVAAIELELAGLTAALEGWGEIPGPEPEMVAVLKQVPKQLSKKELALSSISTKLNEVVSSTYRGASSRSGREDQNLKQQAWQVDNYANDAPLIPGEVQQAQKTVQKKAVVEEPPEPQQVQEDQEVQQVPVQSPVQAYEYVEVLVPAPVVVPPPGEIDVVISPLRAERVAEDALVLSRTVRIDRRTWVQGVALRRVALQEHLMDRVINDAPLAALVGVGWDAAEPAPMVSKRGFHDFAYRFQYNFAEPFTDLHLNLGLLELPQEDALAEEYVPALSILVALIAAVGLAAAYRMIAVSLSLAEQRRDFVSAVTHELKTPLTSIRMYSEMLESGMVPGEERKREYYTTIRAESERLGRLVDDVLTFSRLHTERREPGPAGRLGEAVDEVARILGPQATARGFTLGLEIEASVRERTVDRDAVVQILLNLLDNALKFCESSVDKRVTLFARAEGSGVRFGVRDRGQGVPPGRIRQIFEPFFRGERELVRETRGTGIGLALVSGLATQGGGHADARNHPEGGLEVSVFLP